MYLSKHNPISINKWTNFFPELDSVSISIWIRIFKLPFRTVRETKLQTFQYKIIHHIIPCNVWLFNLKFKNSKICNYCNEIDTQPHFFLLCEKENHFWNYWFNWWTTLTVKKHYFCYF